MFLRRWCSLPCPLECSDHDTQVGGVVRRVQWIPHVTNILAVSKEGLGSTVSLAIEFQNHHGRYRRHARAAAHADRVAYLVLPPGQTIGYIYQDCSSTHYWYAPSLNSLNINHDTLLEAIPPHAVVMACQSLKTGARWCEGGWCREWLTLAGQALAAWRYALPWWRWRGTLEEMAIGTGAPGW